MFLRKPLPACPEADTCKTQIPEPFRSVDLFGKKIGFKNNKAQSKNQIIWGS